MRKEQRTIYVPPQAKTVEIKAQTVLCQSGGNNSLSENELDDNDFETV